MKKYKNARKKLKNRKEKQKVMKKQQLKETNTMRKLMGLELIAEGEEAMTQIENAQKMAEVLKGRAKCFTSKKELFECYFINNFCYGNFSYFDWLYYILFK